MFAALSALLLLTSPSDQLELGWGTKDSQFFFHAPPDPVNVRTLNFFFPVDEHLLLPCVMPIEIKIAYNSYSGDMSSFGEKWTFNHNIRVSKDGSQLNVLEGDGFLNTFTKERNLEEAKTAQIERLIIAQKKADVQSGGLKQSQVYDELKRRWATDENFREQEAARLLAGTQVTTPGTYYSFARGLTTLEMKPDGTYERRFQNGSREFFNKEGRIIRSEDRNGNNITYSYQGELLNRINDMCGRSVTFFYQPDPAQKGLIARLEDSIGRKIVYSFTSQKRLKSYQDTTGRKMEFEHDRQGNITKISSSRPGKEPESIALTYNADFEVTAQKGPGNKETRYKRSFVANNKNHSITEVTKFEGTVMTGRELHEFKVKEYETVTKFNDKGKEVSRETKTISKETGYPISILDGDGNGDKFVYDGKSGRLMSRQSVPGGDGMQFEYEERCDQVKKISMIKQNKPETMLTFKFDEHCNLREAEETANGKQKTWIALEYLKNGKLSFLKNKTTKQEIAFTYWTYGKPESITLKDVGTLRVTYQPAGEIDKVDTFPHGEGQKRFKDMEKAKYQSAILAEVRMTLDEMLNYLRPAGLNIGL